MKTKSIMLLGTASSVGKSTIAAAFCRYFKNKGYRVAPYKALNISLNSYVTKEGDEIGRGQVVQAECCDIEPKEYMNPILMKPSAGYKTQVIVRGKVHCTMDSYKYKDLNNYLKEKAKEAYEDISKDYDLIVLEGSGSCAEINLKETDIANMHTAKMTKSPVILVADIDKGGVFASIVGTIMLLSEEERALVKGIIINKFRGKREYFESAIKQLEDIINIKVVGVMPYFDLNIEDEDGCTDNISNARGNGVDIAVIKLPHMSNFTDFNSIQRLKDVTVRYVEKAEELDEAHLIIIPGSKNTIKDLQYLKENKFQDKIYKLQKQGTTIFGICGGYQMLGELVRDPLAVESDIKEEKALGLLEIITEFKDKKTTKQLEAVDFEGNIIKGYEIHNGISKCLNTNNIWISDKDGTVLGMKNDNNTVFGTYLHGIFDNEELAYKFINNIKKKLKIDIIEEIGYNEYKKEQYYKLVQLLEDSVDMEYIESIL